MGRTGAPLEDGREAEAAKGAPSRVVDGVRVFGLGSLDVYLDTPGLLKSALLTGVVLGLLARTGDSSVALTWPVIVALIVLTPAVILLHEFGHAVAARACGLPVRHVVVAGFGGHTALERSHERGSREALIFFAGPAAASILALVLWWLRNDTSPAFGAEGHAVLYYGFPLTLMAGPGNLVPVFPLDGAGVVRGLLRAWGLDPVTSARATSIGGRLVYFGLLASFAGLIVSGSTPYFAWGGLLFLLLMFPRPSLDQAYTVGAGFGLVRVADVLSAPVRVGPGAPAAETLRWSRLRAYGNEGVNDRRPLVVMDTGGRVFGFLPLSYLHEIATLSLAWDRLTNRDIMLSLADLPAVTPDTPGETAIVYMNEYEVDSLLVMEDGEPVGCVRLDHLLAAAEAAAERRAA